MEALRVGATDYVPKAKLTQDLHAILSRTLRTATAVNRRRRCLHSLLRRESRFELGNDPELLPPFLEFLQDEMSQLDRWDSTEVMRMTIAVDEAIRNAMYHGNLEVRSIQRGQDGQLFSDLARVRLGQVPYRDRRIELLIIHEPERSRFVVHDDGSGFDTSKVDRPIDPDDLLRSSGRGLLLMKSFMDSVSFNRAGNQVTLIKERGVNDPVHRNATRCELTEETPQLQASSPARTPRQGDSPTAGGEATIRPTNGEKRSLVLLSAALNGLSTIEPDFYKRLLDQLHDAVYFVDTRRCILYWNDTAERLTGYSRSEVVGRHCYDGLLDHVDLTGCQLCYHECPLHRAMIQDHPVQDRVLFRHKDGRRISVDVRIMPVRDGEGTVIGGVEILPGRDLQRRGRERVPADPRSGRPRPTYRSG